MFLSRSSITYF